MSISVWVSLPQVAESSDRCFFCGLCVCIYKADFRLLFQDQIHRIGFCRHCHRAPAIYHKRMFIEWCKPRFALFGKNHPVEIVFKAPFISEEQYLIREVCACDERNGVFWKAAEKLCAMGVYDA